ncbi:MAG: mutanobactin A non-ribosomal peptide synthetase MubE [Steroidobacteraceae bacterium]
MSKATTLTEVIENNRAVARAITYLEGEHDAQQVSFGELYERALGILFHLQRIGARRGDKLLVFLANNEQFIDVFWAAILGGVVPVPVALGISDEHRHKLLRIARRLGSPFIYTERRALERIGAFAAQAGETKVFAGLRQRAFLVDDLDDISRAGAVQRVSAGDTAFIQFSSGSTSEPKGVVLTHGNILANCYGATEAAGFNENDVSLSWMPLTHDMGLIGFHLIMFANRVHTHLMPTELFIRRPLLWLSFASRVRATILCSPNFGYRHYLKVLGERAVEGLDLSAVRLIFNGAEPISAGLCDEFLTRLAPAQLPRNTMYPVYGLAEASLAVSFPPVGAPLRTIALNRHRMNVGDPVEPVAAHDPNAVQIICEGKAIPYCRVRIADADDAELPEDRIGHVQMTGDNVTRGYYEDPTANAQAFTADGWLRTGDLGLMHGGELYISGRAKEIIFVNGQNYYPHDLEAISQRVPGLELGKVVAAQVRAPGAQLEQLVMFVLHRGSMADFLPVATQVARLINEQAGLEVAEVLPVKRIPKTTSGKIQRHLLEASYASGEFDAQVRELAALRLSLRGPEAGSRTAIEAKLTAICEAALEGKRVGVHDNLFEIGASSLKLIQIHEQVDHEYPGKVDLTELFDFPTIAELATHLQGKLVQA